MTQFCIKRATNNWRAHVERIVKDTPIFDTREAAEAWVKAQHPRARFLVRSYVAPKPKQERQHHCQICERAILANTGVIAHHGYERPGTGWQTSSCFGALYRPYEEACDALPPAIKQVTQFIEAKQAQLNEHLANPPRGIRYEQKDAYGRDRFYPRTLLRPAGFKPGGYISRGDSYEYQYVSEQRGLESLIKRNTEWLEHLRKRLAAWKEPS